MNENNTEAQTTSKNQSLAIPIAIILGFSLIAGAIFFSGQKDALPASNTKATDEETGTQTTDITAINPVTDADHIKGNPNAPIVLVEYSDFDCPFCKSFHDTITKIMDEFGVGGKVAWVYRHFPLESLHPSAPRIAEASECVASLGGDDAFWKFADEIFNEREINELTNISRLGEFAQTAGVDEVEFNSCLDSGKMRSLVEEDFNNGVKIGAKGTPFTVVLIGGQQLVINGAQPYATVRSSIESLIRQLSGATDDSAAQ